MLEMPPEIDREECIGCQACVQACPNGALEMDDEEKSTLKYPKKCTDVWACVDVCPTGTFTNLERSRLRNMRAEMETSLVGSRDANTFFPVFLKNFFRSMSDVSVTDITLKF